VRCLAPQPGSSTPPAPRADSPQPPGCSWNTRGRPSVFTSPVHAIPARVDERPPAEREWPAAGVLEQRACVTRDLIRPNVLCVLYSVTTLWCTADAHSAAPRLWPVIMMLTYSLYAPAIHPWTPPAMHEQDSKLDNGGLGMRHDELEVVHILQQLGRAAPRDDDVGRRPQATKKYSRTAMSSDPCMAAEHKWSRRRLICARRSSTSTGRTP
jgi:hypothetical protein